MDHLYHHHCRCPGRHVHTHSRVVHEGEDGVYSAVIVNQQRDSHSWGEVYLCSSSTWLHDGDTGLSGGRIGCWHALIHDINMGDTKVKHNVLLHSLHLGQGNAGLADVHHHHLCHDMGQLLVWDQESTGRAGSLIEINVEKKRSIEWTHLNWKWPPRWACHWWEGGRSKYRGNTVPVWDSYDRGAQVGQWRSAGSWGNSGRSDWQTGWGWNWRDMGGERGWHRSPIELRGNWIGRWY